MELFCICLSLVSLLIALFILTHFSTLKCHRTRIHKHLFLALIIFCTITTIIDVDELIGFFREDMCSIIPTDSILSTPILCEIIVVLREYSRFALFAWMFIEGYYLNGLVSASVFGSPRFILYYIFGWMSPLPFILPWVISMSRSYTLPCWHDYYKSGYYSIIEVPRLLLLTINIVLLVNIIRVLVTKLRQNNSGESQLVRKAIKATAVLTPLLGVCNLMYLVSPVTEPTESKVLIVFTVCIFKLLPAIQGFIVALLYCFLNGEVLAVLRRRWSSWRLRRISGNPNRRTSASVFTTLTDVRMATIRDDDEEQLDEKSPCNPQVHIAVEDANQNNKLNGHV
ncbi:PDF receptor-like isoform X2 [Anneissia japonica]|uniref:PDF receptor-like isoform X2 n=1 Tax=Anneissia japonica TaxID=1529436 RepID=UPI0014259C1C|nr:PDF receptor-like isoform X2 [Anneissia japonica]